MLLHVNEMPVPNVEYFWKRSDPWQWNGVQRWWDVFIVFYDGMNGGGGAIVQERWRWNGSSENIRVQTRNLTLIQTQELIEELTEAAKNDGAITGSESDELTSLLAKEME